jgi:hypothetical protein
MIKTGSRVRLLAIATLAATGAGIVATTHGLLALDWPFDLPWTRAGLYRLLLLLAAIGLALATVSRILRLSTVPAAVVTIAVTLTMLGALWSLVVVASFALAAVLVGRRVRRLWRDGVPADTLLDVVVGAGTYASLIGLLAHWPVSHPSLYALLIALPIVWDRQVALAAVKDWILAVRTAKAPPASWIAATLAVVYAIVALFPEFGFDALAMHLFIPGHLAAHRAWTFDAERFAWALMPALGDWLFAIAYMFDSERGVRVLNAGCGLLVAAFVYRLAEVGGASRGWSWFAAALWLSTPMTFAVAASSFIDAEWTMLVLAGIYALLRPAVPGQPPYAWITAGVLLGFAAAAKAVTLPLLPVIVLMALARSDALRARGSAMVLVWAAIAFAVSACKPYATAWMLTGNPVYPFYVHIFGGPRFDYWTDGPPHFRTPLDWTTVYDATFAATRYVEGTTGAPGFQWLILLPAAVLALVATRHRRGLTLAAAGVAMVVVVFQFQGYLRYLLPALAMLVAAIAVAGTALRERGVEGSSILGIAGVAALALNVAYLNAVGSYRAFPIETVLSERERRDEITRALPIRRAAELAAQLPVADERIAFFSQPVFAAAPHADVVAMSWYTPAFQRAVLEARSAERLARTLLAWNIGYVLTDDAGKESDVRRRLEVATAPLVEFPGATVRKVRSDLTFEEEYLRNPDFAAQAGWTLVGVARYDPQRKLMVVTAESPAYQPVSIIPGAVYRNTVRARCLGSGIARVQVNWLDATEKFLSTSLQVFACGEAWTERAQEVVAPANAALAIVYATGGDSAPVEIGAVSLRGRIP